MTQRLRNCTNSTNFETINCDSYLSRLANRDKPLLGHIQRCKRDRSAANIKTTSAALMIPSQSANIKSRTTRQNGVRENSVYKEKLNKDPALVEVTVCTHTGRQARVNKNVRQSWAELLNTKSMESITTFDSYDPLRTIHFLSKELQTKLKLIASGDNEVFEILSTMQIALSRLPPDVSSAATILMEHSKKDSYRNDNQRETPEKLLPEPKVLRTDSSTQTSPTMLTCTDSVTFQKQLEASTAKLESSCKQMEKICSHLKQEKEHVEDLLRLESEKVASLRTQLDILRDEKNICCQSAVEQVTRERNELELKLKRLKLQLSGPTIQELQTRIQELQDQKSLLDQENITYKHKLVTSDMEKEKYVTLLSLRDRQVAEILTELNSLQAIINDHLVDLEKSPVPSSHSSQSAMLDNTWSCLLTNIQKKEKTLSTLYTNELKESESCTSTLSYIASISSKLENKDDSSTISPVKDAVLKTSSHFMQKIKEGNAKDIQNMFNELTRQALFVDTELVPKSKDHLHKNSECTSPISL